MKRFALIAVAASAAMLLLTSCSDPADKVPKTSTSEPQPAEPTQTQAGKEYVIRAESTIGFIGSKVTGSHNGGFKNFAGTMTVADGKIVGAPELKIAMNSTWADNDRLTGHLKSADFFDAQKFPITTFTVTRIEPRPVSTR
jgi:polyisoprenoid-binding protein YceI